MANAQSKSLLIRGGIIHDGSGRPPFHGDVLIKEDRIAAVGRIDIDASTPTEVIDADGRIVCPGFIDAHCHGDPLVEPDFRNYLAMGVTTICLGQDGTSPSRGPIDEWLDQVDRVKPGVNIMTLAGHGTLRHASGIGYDRDPAPTQLEKLCQLLDNSMREGAFGLSTGLEYLPGLYADTRELSAMASVVGSRSGYVMSHMRSEDDPLIAQSIEELVTQGREGHCHVHVSHIKVTYGKGAKRAEEILDQMEAARRSGVWLTADIYPYIASCTTIAIVFPEFAKAPNDYNEVIATRRAELVSYIRERIHKRNGPAATLFVDGPYAGLSLDEAAQRTGKPFEDILIDDVGPNGAEGAYFVMDEALQSRLLLDPHIVISSDGSPTMGHPRGYGAFARIIEKYVCNEKHLSLESAIRKMTGQTAETVGVARLGRGFLRENTFADVLIFDPSAIHECATYQKPHQLAQGFHCIIVNGKIACQNGEFASERLGRSLRNI